MIADFTSLAHQCAPNVSPITLQALVKTESGLNPYAIGVVGGHLVRQPASITEAVATAKALDARGIDFSMGLGQVNKKNLVAQGLTFDSVFDACANLRAGSNILSNCYQRAQAVKGVRGGALNAAFSCYYSGNFVRGFKTDFHGTSYVQRIAANSQQATPSGVVPAIPVVMDSASRGGEEKGRAEEARAVDPSSPASASSSSNRKSWDAFGDLSGTK